MPTLKKFSASIGLSLSSLRLKLWQWPGTLAILLCLGQISSTLHHIAGLLGRFSYIHLLDRTETNIIFIWSVILGEAKPSPSITLPDQINMTLDEDLSNKCFIIPAHVVCTQSIARFFDPDQEAIYQVACSAPLYRFASFIFESRILLRSNWLRCDGIKSVLSQV